MAPARSPAESVVLRYLDRMVANDWEAMAVCLHPEVVRVGPFGDMYTPRDPYVDYLASLLPTLRNYDLTIARTFTVDKVVIVQLAETMELSGRLDVTREVLVFDTDDEVLIIRIEIFIQRDAP